MIDRCEFVGFEASTHLSTRLKSLLNQILSIAPSDSGVRTQLVKDGSHFRGVWKLASVNGQFEAEGESQTAEDLVESLYLQMSEKLSIWEQKRTHLA